MALQSEVSPPMVGDANKDTKIDGDTKSEEENSSQSTDEDVDLEEGEILDSGAEKEEEKEEKDFTNSSLKEALDKSCLLSIEQLLNQAKNAEPVNKDTHKNASPRKMSKLATKYRDHDRVEDSDGEGGWYPPSPKHRSKHDDKVIDYRMELAAYRGTPPSSPERKRDKPRRKRSSKKSKKSIKKRKDIKGSRLQKYIKDGARLKICRFFKEGKCAKGADCSYSHTNVHSNHSSFKKKELCKFYLNGHCNKGKECSYMHSEFPCKFYHTGSECYAKDKCRFSHEPLTEEMQMVLNAYLKIHRGDDDYESRKRRMSRSPEPKGPPPKRPCLLGSPPRHIRVSEETRRWQEEMQMLRQKNHPGFEIHLSPPHESTKINFYQETLPSTPSPRKHRTMVEAPNPLVLPPGFPQIPSGVMPQNNSAVLNEESGPADYVYDDEFCDTNMPPVKQPQTEEFGWKNAHNLGQNILDTKSDIMKQFVEPDQQELDFTNDVKFDETTQFSEMESSTDGPPILSPGAAKHSCADNKENEDGTFNQETLRSFDGNEMEESCESMSQESVPQVVIPSHLPRKQRELFMRIQQHQKKNAVTPIIPDVSSSPTAAKNVDQIVKKEESEDEKIQSEDNESKWYSSEEDDDDDTLKNLLKKVHAAPPPTKIEELPKKPTVSLLEMLNKIQQKNSLEKSKAEESQNKKGEFWKNFFAKAVSSNDAPVSTCNEHTESKHRTLLPNPPVTAAVKKETLVPPKDPRLKNRDVRSLTTNTANGAANLPKVPNIEKNNVPISASPQVFPKESTVLTEPVKENIPYRLHGIRIKPPNYTPYIHASQSNPKLLNDPRLRKHMNLGQANENAVENVKKQDDVVKEQEITSKDIRPPIPKLLLKYEPDSLNLNIFESSPSKTVDENAEVAKSKLADPRTAARRDSRSNSGSDTPPHLTIVENSSALASQEFKSAPVLESALTEPAADKKWLPPVLEKSWIPPVLEKSWTVAIKKEPDSDSENNCSPPHLEIGEKSENKSPVHSDGVTVKVEPPILENESKPTPIVPPLIIKKVKPPPASHLPRAIADPRMAKLHNPLDSRRLRVAASESSSKNVLDLKKPTQAEASKTVESPSTIELKSSTASVSKTKTGEIPVKTESEEKPKSVKTIPKKRRSSDKSDEKKKTVHRNRKSSMDYASPLNSCDDNDSGKSLSYNSYNQRPKRKAQLASETDAPSPSVASQQESSEPGLIADYLLSDSSNLECDNSSDVNLKDMFKTIDPTASPFC